MLNFAHDLCPTCCGAILFILYYLLVANSVIRLSFYVEDVKNVLCQDGIHHKELWAVPCRNSNICYVVITNIACYLIKFNSCLFFK